MEQNGEMVAFRDAMRGFNKADVTEYIETMNRNFSTLEEDYKRVIASQKQQLDSLLEKSNKLRVSQESTSQEKGQLEEKEKMLQTSLAQKEAYAAQLSASQKKAEQLQEENRVLAEKLQLAQQQSSILQAQMMEQKDLVEKAALYDKMSAQLGNMMIHANANADRICKEAQVQAEKTVKEANISAVGVVTKANATAEKTKAVTQKYANGILSTINETLKSTSHAYFEEVTTSMLEVQDQLSKVLDTLQMNSMQFQDKIDTMQATMETDVKKSIDALTNEKIQELKEQTE